MAKVNYAIIPDTTKAWSRYVDNTIVAYGSVKVRLHVSAIVSMVEAATVDANVTLLQKLHDNLVPSDADMLRSWCGKVSAYKTDDGKEHQWLGFKDKVFFVKKGTIAHRNIDAKALFAGAKFYDKVSKAKTDPTLEEIIKYLASIEKNADKKAENGGVSMPAELTGLLSQFTGIPVLTH